MCKTYSFSNWWWFIRPKSSLSSKICFLFIFYSNYSRASGILFQYCRDVPVLDNDGEVIDFTEANITDLFNFKEKLTGQAGDNGKKSVEIKVSLKYQNNFWRTLEMPLINCEITLGLNWSENCVIVATNIEAQTQHFQ